MPPTNTRAAWLWAEVRAGAIGWLVYEVLHGVASAVWGAKAVILESPYAVWGFIAIGLIAGLLWVGWPVLKPRLIQLARRQSIAVEESMRMAPRSDTSALSRVFWVSAFAVAIFFAIKGSAPRGAASSLVTPHPASSSAVAAATSSSRPRQPPRPRATRRAALTPVVQTTMRTIVRTIPIYVYITPKPGRPASPAPQGTAAPQVTTVPPKGVASNSPTVKPGTSSSGQSGGITAGSIQAGTITQNTTAAALNRSKYIKDLQVFYVQGVSIRNAALYCSTDEQLEAIGASGNSWAQTVDAWLKSHMNAAAEPRFADHGAQLSLSFSWAGNHKPDVKTMRDNIINNLAGDLANLQLIMHTNEYDPE